MGGHPTRRGARDAAGRGVGHSAGGGQRRRVGAATASSADPYAGKRSAIRPADSAACSAAHGRRSSTS